MRSGCVSLLFWLSLSAGMAAVAQTPLPKLDSDRDGLSDTLEEALLQQFSPHFMAAEHDCAGLPAMFTPDLFTPTSKAEDGTIYGQVSPVKNFNPGEPMVEVHFFHLWERDCGNHGHSLDTEHVAVLLQASSGDLSSATWKAMYWYAAAHENTVCDVSQIARASTLHAETHGATVWISPGKHASYLDQRLCSGGCGADRCEAMKPFETARIVNLGEPHHAMNGSIFEDSPRWPLAAKMLESNFPAGAVARVNALPSDEIAWYNAGRHPAQGVIAISSSTGSSIAGSGENTTAAIAVAGDKTGNALQRSYRHTRHALGISAHHVGKALGAASGTEAEPKPPRQQ